MSTIFAMYTACNIVGRHAILHCRSIFMLALPQHLHAYVTGASGSSLLLARPRMQSGSDCSDQTKVIIEDGNNQLMTTEGM